MEEGERERVQGEIGDKEGEGEGEEGGGRVIKRVGKGGGEEGGIGESGGGRRKHTG